MPQVPAPILIVGAGHMGGALIAGWRGAGVFPASDLIILDPRPGREGVAAADAGALLNPGPEAIASARLAVLAVKPQGWRAVAEHLADSLAPGTSVISIMAGVATASLAEVLPGRRLARVMPNTSAAIGLGAASLFCRDVALRETTRRLFAPIAKVIELADEDQMHLATAVSGSGPAYLYALVEALEAASAAAGLDPRSAADLAVATITGTAAMLAADGGKASDLRRAVTSPGGTTQAAMEVLLGPGGLPELMSRAVAAAAARSRSLGATPG